MTSITVARRISVVLEEKNCSTDTFIFETLFSILHKIVQYQFASLVILHRIEN